MFCFIFMMTIIIPIYMIYMNSIFREIDLLMLGVDKENTVYYT